MICLSFFHVIQYCEVKHPSKGIYCSYIIIKYLNEVTSTFSLLVSLFFSLMRQLLDDFYVSSPFKLAVTAFNFNLYRAWHSEMHVVELSARPAWLQRHFISLSRACFECR